MLSVVLHFNKKVRERMTVDRGTHPAPKVNDPVRWILERAFCER